MKRWYVIEHLMKKYDYDYIVELGVWKGVIPRFILPRNPDWKYVGVDLYEPQPDNPSETYEPGENGHAWDHETYFKEVSEILDMYDNAKLLRMHTVEAAHEFDDKSIDFVFVDADHSYEGVKADLEAWIPKIRSGGMIAGHDYTEEFPGVIEAVHERFAGVLNFPDNIWAKRIG